MHDAIELRLEKGIAHVQFRRPEKLNALDFEMFDRLSAIADELIKAPAVNAVILSGEGRSFSVGIDREALLTGAATRFSELTERTHGACNLFQWCAMAWREVPAPVIAVLHGHVLGGALQIAMGADIRICTPDAELSVRETAWGLVPDMGGMALLPRLVGDDFAKDLIFTGRTVSGEEAVKRGLVTHLAEDPIAEALSLARDIAKHSPEATRAAKRLVNLATADTSLPTILLREAEEQMPLLASNYHRQAIAAYAETRPLDAKGRADRASNFTKI